MYCFLRLPVMLVSRVWLGINVFKINTVGEFEEKIREHFNNYKLGMSGFSRDSPSVCLGIFSVIYFERASSFKIYYHSLSGPCHYLWTQVLQHFRNQYYRSVLVGGWGGKLSWYSLSINPPSEFSGFAPDESSFFEKEKVYGRLKLLLSCVIKVVLLSC